MCYVKSIGRSTEGDNYFDNLTHMMTFTGTDEKVDGPMSESGLPVRSLAS